jgi:hypothetical protein
VSRIYSQKIISQRLEDFAAREGWMPQRHTVAEVSEFKQYINSLVKIESNSKNSYVALSKSITDRRAKEIRRWIENEQALSALDSEYWETRYGYVCSEEGEILKFESRLSQRIYTSVLADFDESQFPIQLLILKGRQLGITTQTALKFIHRMMFVPHTQAIMASVKASASELIERILNTAYNNSPWWLVPQKMPKGAFANGSILSIQSGMQATGLAQGWTPIMCHVSELADLPNPKRTIEEGLFRAMHPSKNLFMVLEGTGGGSTGWLADTWRSAKGGDHRLRGIFIPWACCPEIYPKVDFIREHPVKENFMATRSDACRKHVARAESYIRNTSYLSRVMGKDYRMPIEQQWFWEFNYKAACQNHTQKTWTAQMPCDDFESLTGKHDPVFDPEVMDELEGNVYEVITDYSTGVTIKERRTPIQTYAITGHDVDEVFYPDEGSIDYEKQTIRISWNSHRGQSYHWDMIPLLPLSEEEEANTMDRLIIYEKPQAGEYYSCGVDTADGLGKEEEDRTVLSGSKNKYGDEADTQVFELTSNKINSAQVVAFAACMGAWYGPMCPDHRGMRYVVEQIRGPGDTCQHQLKMMGFNNHHKPRRYDGAKIKEKPGNKEGWYSNSWSVPMLMTRFIEAVNGGWYIPQSKWLIEELKTLERHASGGKSKMEHRSGQHDDRVRAAAQSYFSRHDDDVLAERAQKRYSGVIGQQQQKKKKQKNGGKVGLVSVGSGWD